MSRLRHDPTTGPAASDPERSRCCLEERIELVEADLRGHLDARWSEGTPDKEAAKDADEDFHVGNRSTSLTHAALPLVGHQVRTCELLALNTEGAEQPVLDLLDL